MRRSTRVHGIDRRVADARPRTSSRRSASRRSSDGARGDPAARVPRRRAEGRPGPRRRSRSSSAGRGPGPRARGRLVVRAGDARPARRLGADAGRAGSTSDDLDRATIAPAAELGCRGISVEWHAIDAAASSRARGRRASRSRPGRSAGARRIRRLERLGVTRDLRRGRGARRLTRPLTVATRRAARTVGEAYPRPMSTPIGPTSWSSGRARSAAGRATFAAPRTGPAGSSSSSAGLAGQGASSRAAGIVRAQGGTPATVALGRWSIDFYRAPGRALRHRLAASASSAT